MRLLIDHLLLLFALSAPPGAYSIGCFVCYSKNGSDKRCEDAFNTSTIIFSNSSMHYYQSPCWGYRKDRVGFFPADSCIKVAGEKETDNGTESILIRTCALDSGSLTADTEIVRISHCGTFQYDSIEYSGCVQSCQTDGCNNAPNRTSYVSTIVLLVFVLVALWAR